MVTQTGLMTADEFRAYADAHPDQLLELVNGRIVPKMPGKLHAWIAMYLGHLLLKWVEQNDITASVYAELHTNLNPYNVRVPDVAVEFEDPAEVTSDWGEQAPAFCVEVQSPTNTEDELRAKAKSYLEHGAQLVWIIYTEIRFVEVLFADGRTAVYKTGQIVNAGDVLPGFAPRVEDLYPPKRRQPDQPA